MRIKKRPRRTKMVDMSPNAIDRRLKDLGQLYTLGLTIKDAKRIGKLSIIKSENS